jgi:DUF438 domain-containing protein
MSEFTENYKRRVGRITNYISGLLEGRKGGELVKENGILETVFMPRDVLMALDNVMLQPFDMEDLKTASNKLFNIIYKNLLEQSKPDYDKDSVLDILIRDNRGVKELLLTSRRLIKELNAQADSKKQEQLANIFRRAAGFKNHYLFMQNAVFPEIEKHIEHHQCLKLMWSFHDDIMSNTDKTIALLEEESFDLKEFNRVSSKVFFNLNTIIFREENVLFPVIHEVFQKESYERMARQFSEFPPVFAPLPNKQEGVRPEKQDSLVSLSTGAVTLEQLELIFSHLPVDMTYVDENDEVRFYSDPKHRIFPRSIGVIGRKVQNCHPHESVHVVEKIVDAFKKGEKDVASFWIKMGQRYVLIKYFAVRNKAGKYRGILEVSQEISEIQKISGERRLLDW